MPKKSNPSQASNLLKFVKVEKKEKKFDISSVLERLPHLKPGINQRFIGAHVSCSPKFKSSVLEALSLGANCFALYLGSSRQWAPKSVSDKDANDFKEMCREKGFRLDKIVPHGSLLLNCGSPKPQVLEKSRQMLVEELTVCHKLGIKMYNFHPGASLNISKREECIKKIAESVNFAIKSVEDVVILLENSAGQGSTIGRTFEELREIIDLVEDKERVGVCFDTCHAFAGGYDISSEEGYLRTFEEFERVLGLGRLMAFHLNDSMGGLDSRKDRHESIGFGKIGVKAFEMLVNDGRFVDVPMVLETPVAGDHRFEDYSHEIKILNDLVRK